MGGKQPVQVPLHLSANTLRRTLISSGAWRRQGWGSGRGGSVLPLPAGCRPPQVLRDKEGEIYLTSGKASGQRGGNDSQFPSKA